MQYDQEPEGVLTPLPAQNIDTGLGLERMAMLQQGTDSVYETDLFLPLIQLGERLSGRTYGQDAETDRALRILADHSRGMSFLVADGVVPSNEDRGYVLRRIMRRAILQGRRIGIEPGFLPQFAGVVRELMGAGYPELTEQADTVDMWLAREEEAFGQTLEQGTRILEDHIERAKAAGAEGIGAAEAFQLHDTYGFPFDLTVELAAEQGLGVDEAGFENLMEDQRTRARASAGRGGRDADRERAQAFAQAAGFDTEFTGYETVEQATAVGAIARENGRVLAKLVESPFYATGGGQIHDGGEVRCESGDCAARVTDVLRIGDDQVLVLEPTAGELHEGERVVALVDRAARRATECNHTATHLLHAALRERLGAHVRQAGSYVGPDKLRFDFTHGSPLGEEDVRAVEDRVNEWILANQPVRALTTTLDEARKLGAMALFGEKYGDVVRMVEVGDGAVVARAVRRHPRAHDRGDRRLHDHHRDVERGQRPPHRGDHRPGRDRRAARGQTGRCARPPRSCAPSRTRWPRSPPSARRSGASWRRAARRPSRSTPASPRTRSTGSSSSSRSSSSATRSCCPTWPTRSRASSATRRWSCWACPATARSTCSSRPRRARSSAA